MAGAQGCYSSHCVQAPRLPGDSLGAQAPCLSWRVPSGSLDPAGPLNLWIGGPRPQRGLEPWDRGATHGPKLRENRRQLRPVLPSAKIPPFFQP